MEARNKRVENCGGIGIRILLAYRDYPKTRSGGEAHAGLSLRLSCSNREKRLFCANSSICDNRMRFQDYTLTDDILGGMGFVPWGNQ
jgi:hypothetical protein